MKGYRKSVVALIFLVAICYKLKDDALASAFGYLCAGYFAGMGLEYFGAKNGKSDPTLEQSV
jgi:hypothetical protein